jgi:hypothetical protein
MRELMARGKWSKERAAELVAAEDEEFVAWAVRDDEAFGMLVEAARQRSPTLF